MDLAFYRPYITQETMMGPSSLRILKELLEKCGAMPGEDGRILDLGCGKGLTSYALCRETGARVMANDLWISGEENAARFAAWGVGNKVTPVCEDADCLRFEPCSFDAIVSIDAYHYFAGKPGYFEEKILPLLKPGGVVLLAVPGLRDAFDGRGEELLAPWLGEEAYMLRSPRCWSMLIGESADVASVQIGEMDCFEAAWMDWLSIENKFAQGDKAFFETIIRPYTNLVYIIVRKKPSH